MLGCRVYFCSFLRVCSVVVRARLALDSEINLSLGPEGGIKGLCHTHGSEADSSKGYSPVGSHHL